MVLCSFHVDKYLREECSKEKYNLPMAAREEFRNHIQSMIYAKTAEESQRCDEWLLRNILKVSNTHDTYNTDNTYNMYNVHR